MRTLKIILLLALGSMMPCFAQQSCPGSNGGPLGGVQRAAITITTSGITTVLPATAGQNIHVCSVTFALSAASDITFVALNGGGNTNISGVYKGIATFAYNFVGELATGLANGFGINSSAAVTGGGVMTYFITSN